MAETGYGYESVPAVMAKLNSYDLQGNIVESVVHIRPTCDVMVKSGPTTYSGYEEVGATDEEIRQIYGEDVLQRINRGEVVEIGHFKISFGRGEKVIAKCYSGPFTKVRVETGYRENKPGSPVIITGTSEFLKPAR